MCWVQPPGTPTVGHGMLDAYCATGEESFYSAAERTGLALVDVQLPCGGWNYVHDFAGEEVLKRWYATIGASGWRLEECQHYYGNATFDDAVPPCPPNCCCGCIWSGVIRASAPDWAAPSPSC